MDSNLRKEGEEETEEKVDVGLSLEVSLLLLRSRLLMKQKEFLLPKSFLGVRLLGTVDGCSKRAG